MQTNLLALKELKELTRAAESSALMLALADSWCSARWFEATAADLLGGVPATTGQHRMVAERLTEWRLAPAARRNALFPRLAPLLHHSSHASLRALGTCEDPETQWLGICVRGTFGRRNFDGRVIRIDRDCVKMDGSKMDGRVLPLQLLVRYDDGDECHLDEREVRVQAQAHQPAHRSESRMFAEMGQHPLQTRQRTATAHYVATPASSRGSVAAATSVPGESSKLTTK